MRVIIVGGVAAGASAAARLRRLSENAEIIMIERGAHPSFANCGLPYYVGGEITERSKLLVSPIARLVERYGLDVRVRAEVTAIDRKQRCVTVKNLETGETDIESYDKLILAPGASPLRPPLPGIDLPGIHTLRNLEDADRLHELAQEVKRATIIGAGFIGLEVAENFVRRGIETTVVELGSQVLPPWDAEMVAEVKGWLESAGVRVRLGDAADEFSAAGESLRVQLRSGDQLETDLVVLSVGVRPENQLAVDAGLDVGSRGGIQINGAMQTSDPDIYAVGDVVETVDFVTGQPTQIPLAGPANRQGRLAADHIAGREASYRGTQGTSIVGLFGKAVGMTGLSEKAASRLGVACEKIYLHPGNHAGYYPGAEGMSVKLLFAPDDGRILGAQVVGGAGVDKRVDVLAMAIQAQMTVYDLEESELAYAPQFGSAKDPVNMAGFIAAGVLRGDHPLAHCDKLLDVETGSKPQLLDVRTPEEFAAGAIPGAINMPVDVLRTRLGELEKERPVVCYCKVGQRGYMATRMLLQHGFTACNLSGGYTTYQHFIAAKSLASQDHAM